MKWPLKTQQLSVHLSPKNSFQDMQIMQISSDILPVTVPLYLFSFVNSKKTDDGTIHGYQK